MKGWGKRASRLLDACFADDAQRQQIANRLETAVADLPSKLDERVAFSIIRLIHEKGNPHWIDTYFAMAEADWRDVLVAAGHGDSEKSHRTWAAEVTASMPRIVLKEPEAITLTVGETGWTRCPNCNFRFKVTDPNAFDGRYHNRCGQRLKIVREM